MFCSVGPMQEETPRHFHWNRPFSQEVPTVCADGVFVPWGQGTPCPMNSTQAFWGWEMCVLTFSMNCDIHSTINGKLPGSQMQETYGCTDKGTTPSQPGLGHPCQVGVGDLALGSDKISSFSSFGWMPLFGCTTQLSLKVHDGLEHPNCGEHCTWGWGCRFD